MNRLCKLSIKIERENSVEELYIDLEDIMKKSQFRKDKIDKAIKYIDERIEEIDNYKHGFYIDKNLVKDILERLRNIIEEEYL